MYEERLKEELLKLKDSLNAEDVPVAIQLPEGLKQFSTLVLDELSDFEPVLFVDPMFGACDLKDEDALKFGCKSLIHFGHAPMGVQKLKTYFVPISYKFSGDELKFILGEVKKLNEVKINIVTTINFLGEVPSLKKELEKVGVEVVESGESSHIQKNHVLGCDSSTVLDTSSPIVFVGDGDFHPNNLGFVFGESDVFVVNPILRESKKLELSDLFLRQRYALIAKARSCKSFGIFVSSKHGQFRLKYALHIKKKLEALGKKAYIFGCDYVNEDYVEGVRVDCFVNTACPRISYDDHANFKKPVITPGEVSLLEDINAELKIDQIHNLEDFHS